MYNFVQKYFAPIVHFCIDNNIFLQIFQTPLISKGKCHSWYVFFLFFNNFYYVSIHLKFFTEILVSQLHWMSFLKCDYFFLNLCLFRCCLGFPLLFFRCFKHFLCIFVSTNFFIVIYLYSSFILNSTFLMLYLQ